MGCVTKSIRPDTGAVIHEFEEGWAKYLIRMYIVVNCRALVSLDGSRILSDGLVELSISLKPCCRGAWVSQFIEQLTLAQGMVSGS